MTVRLIGPGTVIALDGEDRIIEKGGVVVEGNRIAAVGRYLDLQALYPSAYLEGAGGRTIMPGLINAHGHFYGLFARGIGLKDPPPQTFRQVLERLWWRLDKALDPESVYLSAALGGIAALRCGCTTVIDHHASPNAIDGSLDQVGKAMERLGLRAALCYEVSDRDGPERAKQGIAENVRFAHNLKRGGRLAAKFGLHASFTLSTETIQEARRREADLGIGFHIHCAEGPEDREDARVTYGKATVERLWDEGILGERSILAHCIHIDEAEMELLAGTKSWVSHQPHSNMGNGVGWAQMLRLQQAGVRTALGTDGYTWDMIETMRVAAALHAHMEGEPGAGVGQFARSLLRGNAELASAVFGDKVGVLEEGAVADLLLLDYDPPTPLDGGNLPWHLQFGMHAAQVHSVMVDGEWALRDRSVAGLDEAEVATRARRSCAGVWERF